MKIAVLLLVLKFVFCYLTVLSPFGIFHYFPNSIISSILVNWGSQLLNSSISGNGYFINSESDLSLFHTRLISEKKILIMPISLWQSYQNRRYDGITHPSGVILINSTPNQPLEDIDISVSDYRNQEYDFFVVIISYDDGNNLKKFQDEVISFKYTNHIIKADKPNVSIYLTGDHVLDYHYVKALSDVAKDLDSDDISLIMAYMYFSKSQDFPDRMVVNDCVSSGKYCLIDSSGHNSGQDMILETLRSLCLLELIVEDRRRLQDFFDYVYLMAKYCTNNYSLICSEIYLYSVGVRPSDIFKCVRKSFKGENILLDDNSILLEQSKLIQKINYLAPSVVINGQEFLGKIEDFPEFFCQSFIKKPKACQKSSTHTFDIIMIVLIISCSIIALILTKAILYVILSLCSRNLPWNKPRRIPSIEIKEKIYDLELEFKGEAVCSICLCEISIGESVKVTSCLHIFHSSCIDEWLKSRTMNPRCPNCNSDPINKSN